MKLKSLILGSVAAAGLSTGAFAADLGVLTSLDVCNTLGLSGLTISSDTNCLQITGGVSYEFNWGDYKATYGVTTVTADQNPGGNVEGPIDNDSGPYNDGFPRAAAAGDNLDWESQVEAYLKVVGTAPSDFGPAKAVIKFKSVNETRVRNEIEFSSDDDTGAAGSSQTFNGINGEKGLWIADEAYVSVGDTTVLLAGKKSSIANFGDDEPFNFTGLFNSEEVDAGVFYRGDHPRTGGVAVQVVSDLGNGINVGVGLENLERSDEQAGTLVGVVAYAGEGITAHLTGYAGGILDGTVADYAFHSGFTGTFDAFKVRAALAGGHDVFTDTNYWNGLVSAEATFDMFKIAVSGEATGGSRVGETDYGVGGSIGANVTDGIELNLGGRYYNDASGPDGYQIAAQLVAAVTETIKVTGEIGVYGTNAAIADQTDFYGAATLAWAPGGGFTTSLKGEAHQDGAYRVTYKAAKTFE